MKRLAALLIVSAIAVERPGACSLSASAAQEQKHEGRDQIQLRVDLVQLRAVVTDKRGQPIVNLNRDDFEVLEQ